MELLKNELPLIYWLLHTLWEVLVAASTCLIIFLCILFAVYLFNRVRTC